ncbi:MAG: hypothetical protein R3A47_02530 [Polyangiales bacterium]
MNSVAETASRTYPALTNQTDVHTTDRAEIEQAIEEAIEFGLDAADQIALAVSKKSPTKSGIESLAATLAQISSPEALMMLVQGRLAEVQAKGAELNAEMKANDAKDAQQLRLDELEKAIKAAKKKSKRPKWLRKLVKALVSVVAVVATSFSAGALGPLAIAGMVLMFAGDHLVKGLVKAGLIPEKAAMYISLALKIAGTAMSAMGGPSGVAEGAKAIQKLAEVGKDVAAYTQMAVGVAEAVVDTHTHVWEKNETDANINAQKLGFDVEALLAAMTEAIEEFRDSFERFGRVSERLLAMAEKRGEVSAATTQLLA